MEVVRDCARTRPFLGVCLGMQALLDLSEENEGTRCLGIIPGTVRRFPEGMHNADSGERLKIPHMGWNQVWQTARHALWQNIADGSRFYFVHSYYVEPASTRDTAGTTAYGVPFASAIGRENVFAVQFHPEKSQIAGMTLLSNFVRWDGGS